MKAPDPHDVVIVGAGPAGCAAAIELCRHGVAKVMVVDRGRRRVQVGESLPPDTRVLLQRLGVWDDFALAGHEPAWGSCSAWGGDALGYNDFIANPHGHGWHLDRDRFEDSLRSRAESVGVEFCIATVDDVVVDAAAADDAARFICSTDRGPIAGRFVVDASGPAARLARRLGATRVVDDRLSCVAGFFDRASAGNLTGLTMLEATHDGWWYAARLPDDRAVAVAAFDGEQSRSELTTERGWAANLALTRHISAALDGARFVRGSLGVRTAPSARTVPTGGDGWLAIGDASVSFDPLLARGIHQALASGLSAGRAIVHALEGDTAALTTLIADLGAVHDAAEQNRRMLYDMERRWADADFWVRRRGATEPADRAHITTVAPEPAAAG